MNDRVRFIHYDIKVTHITGKEFTAEQKIHLNVIGNTNEFELYGNVNIEESSLYSNTGEIMQCKIGKKDNLVVYTKNVIFKGYCILSVKYKGKLKYIQYKDQNNLYQKVMFVDDPKELFLHGDTDCTHRFSIKNQDKMTCVTNTQFVNTNNYITYDQTKRMSSKLFQMCYGKFNCLNYVTNNNVQVTVFTLNEQSNRYRFILEKTVDAINFYDDYFGVKFPLKKLAVVGIPKWKKTVWSHGIIIMNDKLLLSYKKDSSHLLMEIYRLVVSFYFDLKNEDMYDYLALCGTKKCYGDYYGLKFKNHNGFNMRMLCHYYTNEKVKMILKQKIGSISEALRGNKILNVYQNDKYYPLLEVETTPNQIYINKKLYNPIDPKYNEAPIGWEIPLNILFNDEKEPLEMQMKSTTLTIPNKKKWFKINHNQVGKYIVMYDNIALKLMHKAILNTELNEVDTADFISDLFQLSHSGHQKMSVVMDFLEAFKNEKRYLPIKEIFKGINMLIYTTGSMSKEQQCIENYMSDLSTSLYDEIGWIDSPIGRLIILMAGLHGNENVLEEAQKHFDLFIKGKPCVMLKEIIAVMIRNYAKDVANCIFNEYHKIRLKDVDMSDQILLGLSYCVDPDIIPRLCHTALKNENVMMEVLKRQLKNPYVYYGACEALKTYYDELPSDEIIKLAFRTTKTKERLDLLLGFAGDNDKESIKIAEYNIQSYSMNKHQIMKYLLMKSKNT